MVTTTEGVEAAALGMSPMCIHQTEERMVCSKHDQASGAPLSILLGTKMAYIGTKVQEVYLSKDQQSDMYHQTAIHGNAPSLRANRLNLLQELYLASIPINSSSLLCGQSDKLVQFVTETPYQSKVWQCLSHTPTSRSMEINHQ